MMQIVLFFLITLVSAHAREHDKPSCTSRELRGQDCRLRSGDFKIRLLSETIARDDGASHTVDSMPLKGEGVAWEKMHFSFMGGKPVLQLWVWDQGAGETSVQNLRWYVTDPKRGNLQMLAEGIVRRRHLKPEAEPPSAPSTPPAAGAKAKPPVKKEPVYIYDAMEKHGLKALKNGALEWTLGDLKKTLDFAAKEAAAVAPSTPSPPAHEH